MKFLLLFSISVCLIVGSLQNVQGQGVYVALNMFINTPFFDEFLELRKEAENSVRAFKAREAEFSEEDVAMIRDNYNSSAEYFNRTLSNIKVDLLHKDKRKYIVMYPDSYSKQVETDLRRAKEYYEKTYVKEVAELTEGEITSSAFLALLPQLIRHGKTAFALLQKVRAEIKKFNEGFLDKHFIEPYRFRNWEEIN